ncbi:hypothetical protein BH09BAC3_BH09BAC3_11800 [soil metagenome]
MNILYTKCIALLLCLVAYSSYSQTADIVDSFDDNRNTWWTGESAGGSQSIRDGKLIIDSPDSWVSTIKPYLELDRDFKQEASIRQLGGVDNYGYGLSWGYDRVSNDKNYFIVSSTGYYFIGNSAIESKTKLKGINEWIKSSYVKPLGEVNVLRVEQIGKTITFYINTQKVFSTPAFHWPGIEVGLITFAKMKIEIDDFKFQQNIKINLPANLTTGLVKENLGRGVNSSAEDLNPIISADGTQLYFGREYHEGNIGGKTDGEDFYLAIFDGKKWGTAKNLGSPINTAEVNNVLSVSSDNNKLVFINPTDFLTRSRSETGWGEQEVIGLTYTTEAKFFEGFLSSDGKVIFMTLKNSNNLFYNKNNDERDVYASVQDQNGKWSTPFNLGPKINTRYDEYSPFLAADGRTLYYTSLGKPGYGNADIYMSKRIGNGWTTWSEPVNLGPEINSPQFDAYYVLPASGDYAYMVSNQSQGGQGASDIIRIKLAKELKPDPVVLIKGKTLDAKTRKPISAEILIDNLLANAEVGEAISDPKTGDYQIILPYGISYGFHAAATGHLSVNENLELITISKYSEIEKNLYLLPIVEGQTLQLNNVFFEQARPILKPESYPELDRLVAIMKENPTMEIELGGYTDNVGNPTSLTALSMDRAGTVKKYMVEKGIASKRIAGRGYGSSNPIVKNDTEEHRRMNRRVEFKITKK